MTADARAADGVFPGRVPLHGYAASRSRAAIRRTKQFDNNLSLRGKILLSLVFVIVTMTCCTLFVVRESIQVSAEREVAQQTRNSLLTFQVLSSQQRTALSRKGELLAT